MHGHAKFRDIVTAAHNIAIVSHARPDGDAFGATLGLGRALQLLGKGVAYLNSSEIPERYKSLLGVEVFRKPADFDRSKVDLVIAVDAATPKELGPEFAGWTFGLNLDHHKSNSRYAETDLVDDTYPAACAVIYDLLAQARIPIDASVAEPLYLGLMSDTGNFRYGKLDARTFEIAASLVRTGAKAHKLSTLEFQVDPALFLQASKALSAGMRAEGSVLSLLMSHEEFSGVQGDKVQFKEHVTDQMVSIGGVDVVAFLRWTSPTAISGSLRSHGKYDVADFAKRYGGGGHQLAAGFYLDHAQPGDDDKVLADLRAFLIVAKDAPPL